MIEHVPVKALLPYLNENMLYQFHWGYKKNGRSLAEISWPGRSKELRPILADLVEETEAERVFAPKAVYGYFPAAGDGNAVVLFDPDDHAREIARFDAAAPGQGERPVHRRLPARHLRARARRDRACRS